VLILDGTTNSGTELKEYERSKIKMQVVLQKKIISIETWQMKSTVLKILHDF
jgi:hypothetical protein